MKSEEKVRKYVKELKLMNVYVTVLGRFIDIGNSMEILYGNSMEILWKFYMEILYGNSIWKFYGNSIWKFYGNSIQNFINPFYKE